MRDTHRKQMTVAVRSMMEYTLVIGYRSDDNGISLAFKIPEG
jgi:hypothetical protein